VLGAVDLTTRCLEGLQVESEFTSLLLAFEATLVPHQIGGLDDFDGIHGLSTSSTWVLALRWR